MGFLLVACPHCSEIALQWTLSWIHYSGASWTDGGGRNNAAPPSVPKGRRCEECYWLDDAEKVRTIQIREPKAALTDRSQLLAPFLTKPSARDYHRARTVAFL